MKTQNQRPAGHQALLNALSAEAARRGDNLASLAAALGVTYRRLAQWRSGEADIARASDEVMLACANYLGVPAVLVLMLAGRISLELLLTPSSESRSLRLEREMRRLLSDPMFSGIAPVELLKAHPSVQLFVSYLASEVHGQAARTGVTWRWLQAMTSAPNADGAAEAGPSPDMQDTGLF